MTEQSRLVGQHSTALTALVVFSARHTVESAHVKSLGKESGQEFEVSRENKVPD